MRILIVGNGFTRIGKNNQHCVNRHTADFICALADQGHHISLAQPFVVDGSEMGLNDGNLPQQKVQTVELSQKRPHTFIKCAASLWNSDFVYLFFPGAWSRLMGHFCRTIGKPYGIYLRGSQFSDGGADANLLQNAKFICTVAGLEKRALVQQSRTVPIAPMLDISAEDQFIRNFDSVGSRPFQIAYVGRLEEAKGIPELLAATELLHTKGLPFEMRIVGGGPLYNDIAEKLSKSDAPPVKIMGLISDKNVLMDCYEWADIFVLPTQHEGFPRVLYEAMIKSCVILTTFVGGIPSLMEDKYNCLRLPVNDPEAIAKAILSIAESPTQMQNMSKAGLKTVLNVLETRPMHKAAFEELLNG